MDEVIQCRKNAGKRKNGHCLVKNLAVVSQSHQMSISASWAELAKTSPRAPAQAVKSGKFHKTFQA